MMQEVEGMRGWGARKALLAGLLMILTSLPAATSSEDPGGAPSPRQGGDDWISVDTLEKTVEIQNGGLHFFSIGPDSRIAEMPAPAPATGMPPEVLSAVDRAPDWLREDLMKKFRELATYQVNPGPRGRLALADFDGDGDPDAMAGGESDHLTYFDNRGSAFLPLLFHASDPPVGWPDRLNLSAAAGDLNGDGRPDLVVGLASGRIEILLNNASGWGREVADFSVASYAAPYLGDLDSDKDPDLVVGDGNGRVQYFENAGNRTRWLFQKTTATSLIFAPVVVPGPSCPALADLNGDGSLDLAVGGGNGILHYYQNIGTPAVPAWAPDDLVMFAGIQAAGTAAPSFADLNGDSRTDLFIGESTGTVLYHENVGSSTDPKWQTWPFYDYTPQVGYYPARNYVTHVAYGETTAYAGALNSIEARCVDELAFSIAHSAVEALRQSSPALYVENARSLYENDQYLDYVQIMDHANYSTTRYMVNESGVPSTHELPRDIYYWYIVHPKITDEIPLYIDPNETSGSPNQSRPPPAGKFWRNYLLFNADPAYPPDPPTDSNGDGVPDYHYPRTMTPPLLVDLLRGVDTLWNCTPYSSPAGFDGEGVNNSHPFGYGDHAIERVSNWVMKTLPLNEQESADGERPVQPVRISRGHNGNCGELGDLTVAAARACLIPAAEVSMLAEDHVWIEFYERGWHQWDNYWSDSGAVVDDFMNYWAGWGHRGGSGISKWNGDDYTFEVTSQYVPPASRSHVTVNVRDAGGYPVDGARVLMMSHWLAEQQQLPVGITFPFPAIWNYTDCNGTATFVLAHNNFTLDIVSKLGHAFDNKTYVGEGQSYSFNFTLPGRLPKPSPNVVSPMSGSGRRLDISVEVESGEQRPPNPEVMTTSVQPISKGLPLHVFLLDEANFTRYLSGQLAQGDRWDIDNEADWSTLFPANGTWYLVLWNEETLETSKKVHLRLELSILHETPGVAIDYPVPGHPVDSSRPVPVSGRILGDPGIAALELSVDRGPRLNITSGLDRLTGLWRWEADLAALLSGTHLLTVYLTDALGYAGRDSISIELDRLPPNIFIDSPASGAGFDLGSIIEFVGRATDDLGVGQLLYRLDGGPPNDITPALSNGSWSLRLPGGYLGGGRHAIELRAVDPVGKSAGATVEFELRDVQPPEVRITAPAELSVFELGSMVTIRGTARDNSEVASLYLNIGGKAVDVGPFLGPSGEWSYCWSSAGRTEPGEVGFSVVARDGSGNQATADRLIRLADARSPVVVLLQPANGTTCRAGDGLNLSGTATDDVGVVRLEAGLGEGSWKSILGTLRDGSFRFVLDTAGLPAGMHNLTVRAMDSSGNIGTARASILLEGPPAPQPKKRAAAFLPGLELPLLLAALGILALAALKKRED